MAAINTFGEFEVAPKKGYVSLRRKKQFAMIGPATPTRVEIGLNIKNLGASPRLIQMPPKSMCQYKVPITHINEIDNELKDWLQQAYSAA